MKKPSRILVATDFSDTSLAALDLAAGMACKMSADLVVVSVAAWPHEPAITTRDTDKTCVEDSLRTLFQDRLRTLISTAPWCECVMPKIVVREGDPAQEILRAADEERADIIVVGTHGRRGLSRVVLGSVAEAVIRRAHCPVLVRPARTALAASACEPSTASWSGDPAAVNGAGGGNAAPR